MPRGYRLCERRPAPVALLEGGARPEPKAMELGAEPVPRRAEAGCAHEREDLLGTGGAERPEKETHLRAEAAAAHEYQPLAASR